jgi:hypothetical protein
LTLLLDGNSGVSIYPLKIEKTKVHVGTLAF